MNAILRAFADFLKSKDFRFGVAENSDGLLFGCAGQHMSWTTEASTNEAGSVLTLLSRLPVKTPIGKRGACARLVARLNYGRRLGSFHFDLRDGEALFCISNVVGVGEIPQGVADALVGTTFSAMDHSGVRILKLVYGQAASAKHSENGAAGSSGGERIEFN